MLIGACKPVLCPIHILCTICRASFYRVRPHVAIVGCTGAVGAEMIATLHRRQFPVSTLHLFASARSAGKTCNTPYGDLTITLFSVEGARACDVVFLAVSGTFAKEHAKAIAAQPNGALVIDNSSAFRYDDDIPLVVPEINCLRRRAQIRFVQHAETFSGMRIL